jgi:CheY-like chemotaxis protein
MPVMDGDEAARRIRQRSGGEQVKIVAVTASAFAEQQQEMLDAGMDDLVSKPFRFNEIYDCLSRQLGLRYIYEQTESEETRREALTPEMLSILPEALRIDLKNALEELESEAIAAVIRRVGSYNSKLEQRLSQIVEDYDYLTIIEAIEELA